MLHHRATAHLLSWLLVVLLLPLAADAAGPAVKVLNGQAIAGYSYENTGRASAQAEDGSFTTRPEVTDGAWGLGGVVTAPLYFPWLGGRLAIAGGGGSLETKSEPGIAGSKADTGRIDLQTELFTRNPEFGHLDIGYRFGWESFSGSVVEQTTVNAITFDAGFYVPDNGAGEIDWDFFFSWGRERERSATQEDAINDYTAGAVLGWYLRPTLRLSGGFRWNRRDPELAGTRQDMLGTGELAWLLPFGARRNVTLSIFGGGGNRKSELPVSSSSIDQSVYSVGVGLSFSYPGATSLVELAREYQ
jgi:hypothetical protein